MAQHAPDTLLANADVGRLLGLSSARVRQLDDRGQLACIRTANGTRLYRLADVEKYAALRALTRRMLRNAYGLEQPPVGETSRLDLKTYETVSRLLTELERWRAIAGELSREDVTAVLERHTLRPFRGDEPGRVAVLDLARARTRRFDVVFVLGLEEGSLPRRGSSSPFLDDDARRLLDERGARLQRPDPVSRDRYLFYTACTRPLERLYLVREAATDDGNPREPSPFWDEVQSAFDPDEVRRWTRRRPLSALTWSLDDAPTDRERLRAPPARANAWERRLDRALKAFDRPTRLTHPLVLEQLQAKMTFNVTELERFADCSSAWFVAFEIGEDSITQICPTKFIPVP